MHRTKPKLTAFCALLFGLTLYNPGPAQEKPSDAPPKTIPLSVSVNLTQRVQMTGKPKIKTAENPRPNVAKVAPVDPDPTSVLITGLEAGTTRITLTDEKGNVEVIELTVQQFDVEYLKNILRRSVPTANIVPISSANNTVILVGTVGRAEEVETAVQVARSIVGDRIINALRVGGVMQVQLEVVIAQVSRTEARRMDFEWWNVGQRHFLSNGFGGLLQPAGPITGSLPGGPVTILNSISSVNGGPINGFFSVIDPRQAFFGFLQALRDEQIVKLEALPKVVAMSGRQVSFLSGGEQAIPVPAGLGQVGVQFEEFGVRLNALPIVLGNGKIFIEVEPEVSSLNSAFGTNIGGTVVPGRTTQRLRTTVELESGQTLAIGGLIARNKTGNTRKVPILGDLPFVGTLFSQKFWTEDETELLVMVTPRLVDPMDCGQLPRHLPGQETRSPDDFELFLEGILEAPRGPRDLFPNQSYRAAHLTGPTASLYPCAGNGNGYHGHGKCGLNGCSTNGTSHGIKAEAAPAAGVAYPAGQPLPAAVLDHRPIPQPTVGRVEEAPPTEKSPAPAVPGSDSPAPGVTPTGGDMTPTTAPAGGDTATGTAPTGGEPVPLTPPPLPEPSGQER